MGCATARVWYMSFILSIDFWEKYSKNNTANHRSFQLFFVVYVLYIITDFFHLFTKKIIPRIIAASNFFSGICPYIINRFLHILSRYDTFFNVHLYLFINCHLRANQSVYICYKYLLKWLNKAILSTFLVLKTTALPTFTKCLK